MREKHTPHSDFCVLMRIKILMVGVIADGSGWQVIDSLFFR